MPPTITPHEFVAKWRINRSKERSAAQEHFVDLCRMLGMPTPNEADPTGQHYAFEKGANKLLGGQGWADVWKRNCFAWEYKGKHGDLERAYRQLQQYRESLLNPPLLVTCDLDRVVIHTNFTNAVKRVFEVTLDDIERNAFVTAAPSTTPWVNTVSGKGEWRALDLLRLIFVEYTPETHPLHSGETTQKVTENAARLFGAIAKEMQQYGEHPQATAHFLIRVLFCLFAEDVGLLPRNLLHDMVDASRAQPKPMAQRMVALFQAMREGGVFGNFEILNFDGGLFDDDDVLELEGGAMLTLRDVSALDWSAVEPSIFGTLFERGLDPSKRSQLGAHYTSREDIELIVEPVLMAPLRREWESVKARARELAASLPHPQASGGHALTRKENKRLVTRCLNRASFDS